VVFIGSYSLINLLPFGSQGCPVVHLINKNLMRVSFSRLIGYVNTKVWILMPCLNCLLISEELSISIVTLISINE
jgi:hypothetical protein